MTEGHESATFHIDARGAQAYLGADVFFDDDACQARIIIEDTHRIQLTRIQTVELAIWLAERVARWGT